MFKKVVGFLLENLILTNKHSLTITKPRNVSGNRQTQTMKKILYSKISFYCSMLICILFVLMFIGIIIIPSPAACEGFSEIFTFSAKLIGFIGLLFGLIGIKEPNSIKKWIGLIINTVFVIGMIWDLYHG